MSDRVFFLLLGIVAAGVIGIALVWPQGLGARSPGPFGGPTAASTAPPETPQAPVARDLL